MNSVKCRWLAGLCRRRGKFKFDPSVSTYNWPYKLCNCHLYTSACAFSPCPSGPIVNGDGAILATASYRRIILHGEKGDNNNGATAGRHFIVEEMKSGLNCIDIQLLAIKWPIFTSTKDTLNVTQLKWHGTFNFDPITVTTGCLIHFFSFSQLPIWPQMQPSALGYTCRRHTVVSDDSIDGQVTTELCWVTIYDGKKVATQLMADPNLWAVDGR